MLRTYEAVSISTVEFQSILAERGLFTRRIEQAMAQAAISHYGQLRDNGNSYLEEHIYPVAADVMDFYSRGKGPDDQDEDAIIASLLHDTVEDDPDFSLDECRKFGMRVTEIVWRLTKIVDEDILYGDKLADPEAPHVVRVIKSADRLNNLDSSIALLPKRAGKMRRYIKETDDLYIPMADTLPDPEYAERLRATVKLAKSTLELTA